MMASTAEQGTAIPQVNNTRSTDSACHNLALAEIPPVDDLKIPTLGFTPNQVASLVNMMNTTTKVALDERLGSKAKTERDSAVDLSNDDHPTASNSCDNENKPPTPQNPPADFLTIEMPGFAEEQVATLETMLNTTVKAALDERLGPQTDAGLDGTAASANSDIGTTAEKGSPKGSQVSHVGVNGVEDGSRFAC